MDVYVTQPDTRQSHRDQTDCSQILRHRSQPDR